MGKNWPQPDWSAQGGQQALPYRRRQRYAAERNPDRRQPPWFDSAHALVGRYLRNRRSMQAATR